MIGTAGYVGTRYMQRCVCSQYAGDGDMAVVMRGAANEEKKSYYQKLVYP